jgi:hypothetical protein
MPIPLFLAPSDLPLSCWQFVKWEGAKNSVERARAETPTPLLHAGIPLQEDTANYR